MLIKPKNLIILGYVSLLVGCLVSAYSIVLSADLRQSLSPFVITFYSALVAIIFLFLFNIHRMKSFFRKTRRSLGSLLIINVATAANWLALAYALKFLDPSIVSSISLTVVSILVVLLGFLVYKKDKLSKFDYVIAFCLLASMIYLIILTAVGLTSVHEASTLHIILSILSSVCVGIMVAVNIVVSKNMLLSGFRPGEVMM